MKYFLIVLFVFVTHETLSLSFLIFDFDLFKTLFRIPIYYLFIGPRTYRWTANQLSRENPYSLGFISLL